MKTLPFEFYSAGQFADIAEHSFARKFWSFISAEENIQKQIASVLDGQAPVLPLLTDIRNNFAEEINSMPFETDRIKTMCLNMSKQIMESHGFVHIACTCLPPGSLFSHAGLYERR